MESRKIHDYKKMANKEGIIKAYTDYLQEMFNVYGAKLFTELVMGRSSGRIFGNSQTVARDGQSREVRWDNFFPDQKRFSDEEKKIPVNTTVDALGAAINAAILDDLKNEPNVNEAFDVLQGIGAMLGEAIGESPAFKELLGNIVKEAGESGLDESKYKNFILGEALYSSLLLVAGKWKGPDSLPSATEAHLFREIFLSQQRVGALEKIVTDLPKKRNKDYEGFVEKLKAIIEGEKLKQAELSKPLNEEQRRNMKFSSAMASQYKGKYKHDAALKKLEEFATKNENELPGMEAQVAAQNIIKPRERSKAEISEEKVKNKAEAMVQVREIVEPLAKLAKHDMMPDILKILPELGTLSVAAKETASVDSPKTKAKSDTTQGESKSKSILGALFKRGTKEKAASDPTPQESAFPGVRMQPTDVAFPGVRLNQPSPAAPKKTNSTAATMSTLSGKAAVQDLTESLKKPAEGDSPLMSSIREKFDKEHLSSPEASPEIPVKPKEPSLGGSDSVESNSVSSNANDSGRKTPGL